MQPRASNSLGPMWCAPRIEGQYLRDEITKIVMYAYDADWFRDVYELLDKHQIPVDWRAQFYQHAQGVADANRQKDQVPAGPG